MPPPTGSVACASVPECPLRGTREILSCVNVEMHLARVVGLGLSLLVLTALGGTAASSTPALPLLPVGRPDRVVPVRYFPDAASIRIRDRDPVS